MTRRAINENRQWIDGTRATNQISSILFDALNKEDAKIQKFNGGRTQSKKL